MAYLEPLPPDTHPELEAEFAVFRRILGFVPNSLLTLQRRPAIVQGFSLDRSAAAETGLPEAYKQWLGQPERFKTQLGQVLVHGSLLIE